VRADCRLLSADAQRRALNDEALHERNGGAILEASGDSAQQRYGVFCLFRNQLLADLR